MQLVEYMEAVNRSSGEKSFSGTSYPDVEVPKQFDIVKSEPASVDQSKNFFDQGLEALSQWTLEKLEPSHSNSFSSPIPSSQQVAQLDFTQKRAHHQQGSRSEQQVSRSESSLPIVEGKGFVDSTWVSPDHCVLQWMFVISSLIISEHIINWHPRHYWSGTDWKETVRDTRKKIANIAWLQPILCCRRPSVSCSVLVCSAISKQGDPAFCFHLGEYTVTYHHLLNWDFKHSRQGAELIIENKSKEN